MRVTTKQFFWLGLVAAILAGGAIDAAVQDDGADTSAKAGSRARASAEPSPTPSSQPPGTPSPVPSQTSSSADDEPEEICYPLQTLEPLPRITLVVDPQTGRRTLKEIHEDKKDEKPPEPVCIPMHQPSYGYPYSYQPPGFSGVAPTNAPGYPPGFGSGYGSEGTTGKDRRVPITTDRGGMPDLAPTVPRAPAVRVPAFIP